MTQTIDGRVVEMKFDNSDFEKNVAQSMSTLDKLKQALNIDSAKSLQDIGKATKSFDLNGVGTAVETVQAKFSALQIVGYTALQEITKAALNLGTTLIHKVLDPIKSGGMNRALNIEQAKFQLEGLGVAWKDIEEDINYGVKDTAYGLDVAAKAASQLTASGVTLGDEMKAALRGISGVASMTSSSYEEISPIFTTIAGQGKVMTMQLRQLESRGLNAAATLAKSLGTTEAAVREMVKDGEIDFQTFSKAMDDAFGSHAKDANKTFTGAMSNVRAALSRIGANFATPYMDNMRLIFVETIDVINGINKALGPIYKDVAGIMEIIQKGITGFLKQLKVNDIITPTVNAIRNAFYALLLVLQPIKEAFKEIFPKPLIQRMSSTAQGLEKFTSKLVISEKDAENLKSTFKGLFSVLDIIGKAFKAAFNSIAPFTGGLGKVLSSLLSFTGGIGDYLVHLDEVITKNDTFGKIFGKVASVIQAAANIISGGLGKITDAAKKFKQNHIDDKDFSGFTNFFEAIKNRLASFGSIGDILKTIFNGITNVLGDFSPVFQKIVELISGTIGSLLRGFSEAFKGNKGDAFSTFLNVFSSASIGTMIVNIAQAFAQLGKSVRTLGGLSFVFSNLTASLKQVQADIKADVLVRMAKAIAIFAGSILVLSLIEPSRLAASLGAIEVLLLNFKLFTDYMTKSVNGMSLIDSGKFYPIVSSFQTLGVALLIMSAAVKVLSTIDLAGMAKGITGIIVMTGTLVVALKSMQELDGKQIKVGASMISMAIALRILAEAVEEMGKLNLETLVKGIVSTIIALMSLSAAIKLMGETKVGAGTGLAIIEMSAAILILTNAVETLGNLPNEILTKGMVTVGVLIAFITAFEKITSGTKGAVAVGLAVIEISAALLIFASVVEKLGSIPLEQLAQGFISIAGALVLLGGALAVLANFTNAGDLLLTATAFTVFSVALNLVALAISSLAAQNPVAVIGALVALAAAIAGFGIAATLLAGVIPAMLGLGAAMALLGVSVLALGAGLLMLSGAVAAFVSIGPSALGVFLGLTAGLVAFAGVAVLLSPALVPMAALAGILALIGVSALAVGAGLTLLSMGLSAIATLGTAGAVAIELVSTALVELGIGVVAVAASIAVLTASLIVISAGFVAISATAGTAAVAFGALAIAAGLSAAALTLLAGASTLASGGITLLASALALLFQVLSPIIPEITKVVNVIKNKIEDIKKAALKMVADAINGVKEGIKGVVQLGKDFVDGFIKGIKETVGKVADAAKEVAKKALSAVKKTQDSNSPAKETQKLGSDFGDGYTIGIKSSEKDVASASQSLANSALSPLKDASSQIPSLLGPIETFSGRFGSFTEKNTNATAELRKEMIDIKKPTKDFGTEVNELAIGQEKLAENTGKATSAGKEQKSFLESMQDTISNQLDIFSKFEIKQEVTAEQMLENMRSNISGFASWSHRLAVLAERGINQALYQKLAEMGPKGYETVAAFVQMTDAQLKEANDLFAQSMTLPESQAAIVQAGFTYAGEMASKGFSDALNDHKAAHDAAHGMGEAAIKGVDEALQIHSPSKVMHQKGWYAQLGFRDGLRAGQTVTLITVKQICNEIIEMFSTELDAEKFGKIGNQFVANLFTNMLETNEGEAGNPIVKALISGLTTFELIDAAVTTFTRHVKDTFNACFEINGDGGESGWAYRYMQLSVIQAFINALITNEIFVTTQIALFCLHMKNMFEFEDMPGFSYDIGMNIALGLRDGINDYAEEAISAARAMAEEVMAILASIPDINSPSKVTRKLGGYISLGYAIGIEDGANNVYKAAEKVANNAIDGISSGRIQDMLSSEFDFNPIITPILDLSYVREQLNELDSMMRVPLNNAFNSQNEGNNIGKNSPSQINFTQNNYSPKSLSRYEIYRQTKNQISQLKGVMA